MNMYNLIIRPLLFCIDPEKVHRMLLSWLKFYRYLLIRYVMQNGVKQTTTYSGSTYGTLPTNINVTWIDEEGRFYEVSKTVVDAPTQ